MGIPSYFSHIIRSYKGIILPFQAYQSYIFQHLFMDCNSIIYDCLHTQSVNLTEEEIIQNTAEKIKEYIHLIRPTGTVFIAFDGVAPFAKMDQQRDRRCKMEYMKQLKHKIAKSFNIEFATNSGFDKNQISPGTNFMKKLSKYIKSVFLNSEQEFGIKQMIVSAADEIGEGEHKIFSFLRINDFIQDDIVIYGLDSDLFMLSILNYKYYKNCYIFREAPEFIGSIVSFDQQSDIKYYVINNTLLREGILRTMQTNDERRISDYVFMCFFLGNDFLPKIPALNIRTNGMQVLIDVYNNYFLKKPKQYLTSNCGKIEWKHVFLFIKMLANLEMDLLIKDEKMRDKMNTYQICLDRKITEIELDKILNDMPIYNRAKEKYINAGEDGWEERYYKALFDIKNSYITIKRKEIVQNYLEGLEWVYKYYSGEEIDWRWKYEESYGPLLCDFGEQYKQNKKHIKNIKTNAYSEEEQLNYIMPKNGEKMKIEWTYKRYIWEGKIKK